MQVQINGEAHYFNDSLTLNGMLQELGFDPRKIAVERNLEIVPRGKYDKIDLKDGDQLEIVHFIGGGSGGNSESVKNLDNGWEVAGRRFESRLIVGTG